MLSTARQHATGASLGVDQGQREMRVGQKMSRLITRNVIIMALTLVVCLPLLQAWGESRQAVLAEGLRTVVAVYTQQGLEMTPVGTGALDADECTNAHAIMSMQLCATPNMATW